MFHLTERHLGHLSGALSLRGTQEYEHLEHFSIWLGSFSMVYPLRVPFASVIFNTTEKSNKFYILVLAEKLSGHASNKGSFRDIRPKEIDLNSLDRARHVPDVTTDTSDGNC